MITSILSKKLRPELRILSSNGLAIQKLSRSLFENAIAPPRLLEVVHHVDVGEPNGFPLADCVERLRGTVVIENVVSRRLKKARNQHGVQRALKRNIVIQVRLRLLRRLQALSFRRRRQRQRWLFRARLGENLHQPLKRVKENGFALVPACPSVSAVSSVTAKKFSRLVLLFSTSA